MVLLSYMSPANTPLNDSPYIWIWGLHYWRAEYYFNISTLFSQVSLTLAIVILSCVICIIINANKLRRGEFVRLAGALIVSLAVLILVVAFVWAVVAHTLLYYEVVDNYTLEDGIEVEVRYTIQFWDYNLPSFGFLGLILGAIIILYGGIIEVSRK